MNQKKQLGQYVNTWLGNTLGVMVVVVTAGLGVRLIMSAAGLL
ncbi:MAG: Mn2+/Fe2+ NRAMP family transporter [Paraglaciecola sp.]|jgi:Mn2+/Fe2+ NRAMP family transporter